MASQEHWCILQSGVEVWNRWRQENPMVQPDLSHIMSRGASLAGAQLQGVNLQRATLDEADLRGASLHGANLSEAHLSRACLAEADLGQAALRKVDARQADLRGASLAGADLGWADLRGANLAGANLSYAALVGTQLQQADLSGCRVLGSSAWKANLQGALQTNLVLSAPTDPALVVDGFDVAQLVGMLLHNPVARDVLGMATKPLVLIFSDLAAESAVLPALRTALRERGYLVALLDVRAYARRVPLEPASRLAPFARMAIADLTASPGITTALRSIVPLLNVPLQPVILKGASPLYVTWRALQRKYPWVLEAHRYERGTDLMPALEERLAAWGAEFEERRDWQAPHTVEMTV